MKKLLIFLTLITVSACESIAQKEAAKTAKHSSASDRINSTNSNSDNLFKEIDQ